MLNAFLDSVLGPLFAMNVTLGIALIAFMLSLVVVLVYKFFTDQTKMGALKEDLKKYQEKLKGIKNPDKMLKLQKEMMDKNMEYMMQSLKPTLITFIPIVLIFGWLNAHLSYMPILPGEEFGVAAVFEPGTTGSIELSVPEGVTTVNGVEQQIVDARAVWRLNAEEGAYLLSFKYDDETYKKDLLVTSEQRYAPPFKNIEDSKLDAIKISNEKLIVMDLFGWKIGWLGSYIIFSLILSIVLRRLLKVH